MPLEVIEKPGVTSELVRFQTSTIYELIISLRTLLKSDAHLEFIAAARAALSPDFGAELEAVYEPFMGGALFFELAVDYPDQHDVPGFLAYVRSMEPMLFMFYVVGRVVPPEEVAAMSQEPETFRARLAEVIPNCKYCETPLEQILADVPAFQARLVDLWQWYWQDFFSGYVDTIYPHWARALENKRTVLVRSGEEGLLEHVTGKAELPPPLPADQPVTDIVFVPLYLLPSPVYLFYGYGNVTILFDSERTEDRRAEIQRDKDRALTIFKALADSSRLDILRVVAHYEGRVHGKAIAEKLNLSPSAVSRHLNQLKDAGLIVEESQDNRTITYRLQVDVIKALPDIIKAFLAW